jgi:hypothetical protein
MGIIGSCVMLWQAKTAPDRWTAACALAAFSLSGVIAVFMLRGANWARVLFFTVYLPAVCVLTVFVALDRIFGLPFYLLLNLFLLNGSANRFFLGRSTLFRKSHSRAADEVPRVEPETSSRRRSRHRGGYDY